MDQSRLDEIRARCEAATPGKWFLGRDADIRTDGETIAGLLNTRQDAEFIAHAREDVPWLLGEVERLHAEMDAAKRDMNGVCADCLWCTESDATNRIYCVANGDGSEFETFPGEWCSGFTRRITDKDLERVWEESE